MDEDEGMLILGDKWDTAEDNIGLHYGGGYDKEISVNVRYDGNGNSVVRFIVKNGDKETTFEKFDAAATYYNGLPPS